jgi:hypothetical protein
MIDTEFDLFLERVRHHQRRLAAGDDPLDADIAVVIELRMLLQKHGISLPSAQLLFALADGQDGGRPSYLLRPKRRRSALTRHRLRVGHTAYLVETLYANQACSAAEAQRRVAAGLRKAGLAVTDRAVAEWHRDGALHAKRPDPARHIFERQQAVFRHRYPDHGQWSAGRWRQWLDDSIRELTRLPEFYR